jgi:hypothetical protein
LCNIPHVPATTHQRTAANTLLRDATRYATFIDQAIRNIDQNLAGYPSNPNTGRPNPIADSDVHLTTTERQAITRDPARQDLEKMLDDIRIAIPRLQTAAAIAQRWACYQLDGTTIQARLATIEATIWCKNCIRHGHEEPRSEGLDECELCTTIRRKMGRPAPHELVETMRRQRNLNRLDHEILTWRRADEAAKKERQRAEKARRKAEEASKTVPEQNTSIHPSPTIHLLPSELAGQQSTSSATAR